MRFSREQRLIILALMAMVCIAYIDRVAISFGLIYAGNEFRLSPVEHGLILSAFSWGYVTAMAPGGWLADRLGPGRILSWAIGGWSVASVVSAFAGGPFQLFAARFTLGTFEAPSFPAGAGVIARRFSLVQRGRATALFDGGSYIGLLFAGPAIGYTMAIVGWRYGLGLCGAISALWLVAWLSLLRARSLRVNVLESQRSHDDIPILPRLAFLLRQRSILMISLGFFSYNYVKSFFLTWFPIFLVRGLDVSRKEGSLLSAIPPAVALMSSIGVGILTDRRISRGKHPARTRRRFIAVGLAVSSAIAIAAFIKDTPWVIVALTVSFSGVISASSGIWAIPADISPDISWVSTIGGLQNTVSNLAGIVAPIVTGYALQVSGGSYILALSITSVVSLVGASMYLLSGPLDPLDEPGGGNYGNHTL